MAKEGVTRPKKKANKEESKDGKIKKSRRKNPCGLMKFKKFKGIRASRIKGEEVRKSVSHFKKLKGKKNYKVLKVKKLKIKKDKENIFMKKLINMVEVQRESEKKIKKMEFTEKSNKEEKYKGVKSKK